MQRLQACKYELRPDGQQERQMRRFAGSCRFVFNKALALQKERCERGGKKLGYAGLCKLLTGWRNSTQTAWLADAPVHPLQQTLRDLERAYSNFFARRADFPRFKKKGQLGSFRYPDPKQIKPDEGNSRIFLPRLGWLRYRNSRKVPGKVKNITMSQSCGKWFVSIQTEHEVGQPVPNGGVVGIDMGIARFATLSNGSHIEPLNSFRRHETALRRSPAGDEPQDQVQQQLEKSQIESSEDVCPYRQHPPRLPAQGHDHDQPKPRDGVYRGLAGAQYVQVSGRHGSCAGKECSG